MSNGEEEVLRKWQVRVSHREEEMHNEEKGMSTGEEEGKKGRRLMIKPEQICILEAVVWETGVIK